MLNNVILQGRLTKDIDLRYTNSGTAVGNFTLASERNFTGKDGKKETDFVDCTVWGKKAEAMAEYLGKGNGVIVKGELQQDKWQNDDGKNRSKLKVNVAEFNFPLSNGKKKESFDAGEFDTPF